MPRFRFRLATLRRLRETNRDELRFRLAAAFEAERILTEQRTTLNEETVALATAQRSIMAQSPVDVNSLLTSQRYHLALLAQRRSLDEQAAKLAEEVERRRQAVVEADREVRVLDKLEERQVKAHREAAGRLETKQLDEVGSNRWEGRQP